MTLISPGSTGGSSASQSLFQLMSEDGATKTAHRAAQQVTAVDLDDFKRSLINEGVFHALVEGGFHSEALSDDEAEFLAVLITEEGVIGLEDFAETDNPGEYRVTLHFAQ